LPEFRVAVVPRNSALPNQFAETHPIHLGKFGRLTQRERSLGVKRDRKFGTEPLRNLSFGNAETLEHRVRYVQSHPHVHTIALFVLRTPPPRNRSAILGEPCVLR